MKKYLKRFFVLTMLCMLVTSTALNVSAAELNLASDLMTIEEEKGLMQAMLLRHELQVFRLPW